MPKKSKTKWTPPKWDYSLQEPELPAGSYELWVGASDKPKSDHSPGVSAAAVEISLEGNSGVVWESTVRSKGNESDESRGYLGGIAAGLQTVGRRSTITVNCRSESVCQGLV